MKKAYVVKHYYAWCDDHLTYYSHLEDAKKALEKVLKGRMSELRKQKCLCKRDAYDEDKESRFINGRLVEVLPTDTEVGNWTGKGMLWAAVVYFWNKVSIEYNDWDVEQELFCISEVTINE